MKLIRHPLRAGLSWWAQGFALFRRSPLGFTALIACYLFAIQLALLVPAVGAVVMLLGSPVLSLGFFAAGRAAASGERVTPALLIAGWRDAGARQPLWRLALLQALVIFGISLLIALNLDADALQGVLAKPGHPDPALLPALLPVFGLAAALYLPFALAMWFAPPLIAWGAQPPGKALFFSLVACWRNRGAMVVFGAIWLLLVVLTPLALSIGLELLGADGIAPLLIMPYSLVALAVMAAASFASWNAIFRA